MAGAPDRKYTDADVRADPELGELAYEYLETYSGEFEPLVKAQQVLARGSLLTTSLTRVVLNCMRNDWDIADQLPQPMAKVIDMPVRDDVARKPPKKHKKQKRGYLGPKQCSNSEYHSAHNQNEPESELYRGAYWHCAGKSNGRTEFLFVDAKIKTPYVKAPGGKMIHLLGEGSYFHWRPNTHGIGFGRSDELWGRFPPRLHVKLLCKHPSWLYNPQLLWEIPEGLITNEGQAIGLCPHCEKESK